MARTAALSVPGGSARFRALMDALVPESDQLRDEDWPAVEAIVARAVSARPPRVRRQLGLFMRLLEVIAFARHRRTMARLTTDERFVLLDALSKSRMLLVRRGVWGLRTLALMGFYARPEAGVAIGYRASITGWDARRSAASPIG